ncbi:MAG TPA: PIG-L family deacetylase [Acidobacteriaceae bacterium]
MSDTLRTTRREMIRMGAAAAAFSAGGGTALSARQLPGQAGGDPSGFGRHVASDIMAIAAHPGDAFFAMGAPVALATHQGQKGYFLSLTPGERGSLTIPPERYGPMQRDAARRAATMMGAETLFLDHPDGQLPVSDEVSFAVCDLIRRYKPTTVITHWKGSWHKDHRASYEIVQNAIFYAGLATVARALPAHGVTQLFFADNWEDADGFTADTFLDISPVFGVYLNACGEFPMWRGENGFRYNDYYSSRAVECGCLSHCRQGVALMSPASQRVRALKAL